MSDSASSSASAGGGAQIDVSLGRARGPPPPQVPSFLSPHPRNFKGYKLAERELECSATKLPKPLRVSGADATQATGGWTQPQHPSSFLSLASRLRINHLVLLHAENNSAGGSTPDSSRHRVYFVDHSALWTLDSTGAASVVHPFHEEESGEGLSIAAVTPCFLLLTRAGGRLTIFRAPNDPAAEAKLDVLFDGSPLSPAPLAPHDATIASCILSGARDHLFVLLYEVWESRASHAHERNRPIQFVHEGDALRSAGVVSPGSVSPDREGSRDTPHPALHKLTLVQFAIRDLPGFPNAPSSAGRGGGERSSGSGSARSGGGMMEGEGVPALDLLHTFSSVHNHPLLREDMPPQHAGDAQWAAPLASWLALPSPSTHAPPESRSSSAVSAGSASGSVSPPTQPVHWFVVARVPYLNETESTVYEMRRMEAEAHADERERVQAEQERAAQAAQAASEEGKGDESDSKRGVLGTMKFTSDKIESAAQGLKNYALDAEDEDEDMNELGATDAAGYSIRSDVDASIQLFDVGVDKQGRPMQVVGVKRHDDLILYGVHAAPQVEKEGLSLGAAGSLWPQSDQAMSIPRLGIVLQPLFQFAGLGYVQSGKKFKRFFMADPSTHFVAIAEYARHVFVYERPTATADTTPHYLLPVARREEAEAEAAASDAAQEEEKDGLIIGMATSMQLATTSQQKQQATPTLYVLTRTRCMQVTMPTVALSTSA